LIFAPPGNLRADHSTPKIVVYGMEDLETAEAVFERISATLIDMDPELKMAEVKGDKSNLN